jgi:type IV pilus assembly protein PilA
MRNQNTSKSMTPANSERGFSLIELLIVVAIILIIAAIAIPNMLKSKMAANQASSVANLRTISTASVSYWVVYTNGYPPSLAAIGGLGPAATCNAAVLMDVTITTAPNQKNGYQYAYAGTQGTVASLPAGCGTPGYNGYLATATPLSFGVTGNMSYCSSEPGVIHYDITGVTAASEAACDLLPVLQ